MHALTIISAIFVISGLLAALFIALDLRRRPQPMKIMNSVWVLTGLWAGPLGLWGYCAIGRAKPAGRDESSDAMHHMQLKLPDNHGAMEEMPEMVMRMPHDSDQPSPAMSERMDMPEMSERPKWRSVVLSTLHCGAGCTLADLVGEWFAWFIPISVGGSLILGSWILDYLLALVFGIGFQYAAIRSMRRISPGEALLKAGEADFLSLTAWQAGMYGWMALVFFVFFTCEALPRTGWTFWFMMQIAMLCGFCVALPVNRLLIRKGIKHAM